MPYRPKRLRIVYAKRDQVHDVWIYTSTDPRHFDSKDLERIEISGEATVTFQGSESENAAIQRAVDRRSDVLWLKTTEVLIFNPRVIVEVRPFALP